MCKAIKNKRRELLTFGVGLLNDDGRPDTAARTRARLEHFNWQLFDHHSFSPDLASSDCHVFTRTYLNICFGAQRFNNNELMEGVKTWMSSRAVGFFDTGIQKITPRYYKCLNSGGDYTEK
jgi:histone-lysine N-methyltransferase SETMAR